MRKNTYIQTVIMIAVSTTLKYGSNILLDSLIRRVKK